MLLIGEPGSLFEISTSFDGAYLLLSITRDTTGVGFLAPFAHFHSDRSGGSIQANKLWIAENKMSINGPSLEWIKLKDAFDGSLT